VLAERVGPSSRPPRPRVRGALGAAELAEQIASVLTARRLTLALAEASSGGLLADALTSPPGASAYFLGGVVAYSNQAKVSILGVSEDVLARHGAVSPEAAQALARGARHAFGSDLGLAVSGILGPGGGSPAKPVGLTYVAVDGPTGMCVARHELSGDRAANKRASVQAALRLLLAELVDER
jgi:PncC family amidohydrolase